MDHDLEGFTVTMLLIGLILLILVGIYHAIFGGVFT